MARVTAAVERIGAQARAAGVREVIAVGHGRAFTLLVASLTAAAPDVDAWTGLLMPDHCALELSSSRAEVISPWGAWRGLRLHPTRLSPGIADA